MSYTGVETARGAREDLGNALAALQEDPNIPQDVLAVAQNIAQAVGALFEAERASTEPDGKSCVRNALGSLSQTLALLQDVQGEHAGIGIATEVIARSMSALYPLTTVPSKAPSSLPPPPGGMVSVPQAAPVPQFARGPSAPPAQPSAAQPSAAQPSAAQPSAAQPSAPPSRAASLPPLDENRPSIEANIGATTESNFFVGFSGEISEGGVFLATYETFAKDTLLNVLVTLPGGFEMRVPGRVRFVRDPLDFSSDSDPGMGIQFERLDPNDRELILRFIRKRAPMFYDD